MTPNSNAMILNFRTRTKKQVALSIAYIHVDRYNTLEPLSQIGSFSGLTLKPVHVNVCNTRFADNFIAYLYKLQYIIPLAIQNEMSQKQNVIREQTIDKSTFPFQSTHGYMESSTAEEIQYYLHYLGLFEMQCILGFERGRAVLGSFNRFARRFRHFGTQK